MGRLIDASLLDWWYKGRQIRKVIDEAPTVDPIHYAGGCYCWECEKNENGHCLIMRGCSVAQIGFCGYGRRREDA